MKTKSMYKSTESIFEFRVLAKEIIRDHLNCSFCPPNKGENASGKRTAHRSWKRYRANQYRSRA